MMDQAGCLTHFMQFMAYVMITMCKYVMHSHLGVFLIIVLLRSDPSADQLITDSVGESEIIISVRRHISVLHQSVMKVPVKRSLQVSNICNLRYASHTDLTAPFNVGLWFRHPSSDNICKNNEFCRF